MCAAVSVLMVGVGKVFKLFDPDGVGFMDARRLLLLGRARRALGHKHGMWSPSQNNRLLDRLDSNDDGKVSPKFARTIIWTHAVPCC